MALRSRNANFDLRRRVFCGPAQGKHSNQDPPRGFAQAKRKFDLPKRVFCGPAQEKRKFDLPRRVLRPYHVDSGSEERKSPRRYSETPKKIPALRETQILTSGDAFFVALRKENILARIRPRARTSI